MDWQSAFQVPVSQPRPILPMQPGFRVDLETRVGVSVGTVVDVGVGAPSNTVTGVLVAVGVWVAAGAPSEPPSSASSRAVSLSMSARSELINPPCSSIWSRWVVTWFCSVVICSCCVLDWASSWLILALAFPDVVTVVAVRVGVGVIGAPLSSRVVVAVGVRVGVAVGGVPVAVGVAVGGVPVTVGVCVGVSVAVGVAVADTPVGVLVSASAVGVPQRGIVSARRGGHRSAQSGVGVAVAPGGAVGVSVGVGVGVIVGGSSVGRLGAIVFPQHTAMPLFRSPQVWSLPELMVANVPDGGVD